MWSIYDYLFPLVFGFLMLQRHSPIVAEKQVMAYLFPSVWINCAIKYQLFMVDGFSICHDTAGASSTVTHILFYDLYMLLKCLVRLLFERVFPFADAQCWGGVSQKSHVGNHWNILALQGVDPAGTLPPFPAVRVSNCFSDCEHGMEQQRACKLTKLPM